MQNLKNIFYNSRNFLVILSSLLLSSCIAFRSSDYMVDSTETILQNKRANYYETNVGIEFPQQLLYIPMYGLYGGLSAIFMPFSKDFYKNDLKTIITDFDSEINSLPVEDPSLIIIPSCNKDSTVFMLGFIGKESELTHYENNKLINDFEIRIEDIYLAEGNKELGPSTIYLAGTKFDKISSRFVEVAYPIFRTKKRFYRFVKFSCNCKELIEKNANLVISKIYHKDKIIKNDVILRNFSLVNFKLASDGQNIIRINMNSK